LASLPNQLEFVTSTESALESDHLDRTNFGFVISTEAQRSGEICGCSDLCPRSKANQRPALIEPPSRMSQDDTSKNSLLPVGTPLLPV
jgi:hypothetical protein